MYELQSIAIGLSYIRCLTKIHEQETIVTELN
jgi:hypothetical protein